MNSSRFAWSIPVLLLGLHPAYSDEMPDLAKCRSLLRKEPTYISKCPLYGLAAFGLKADKAIWLVLDKSKPDNKNYDVLFLDRNGDGDLTGPEERVLIGTDNRFHVHEFKDPATGVKHGALNVRVDGEDDPTVMVSVRWRDKFRLGGGYPQDPAEGYLHFAKRPAEAPVLWVCGDEPFQLQRWYSGKLTIGGNDDFKVFLGRRGLGQSVFCAAQEHILPEKEWVKATLLYKDSMGREKRLICELRERC